MVIARSHWCLNKMSASLTNHKMCNPLLQQYTWKATMASI